MNPVAVGGAFVAGLLSSGHCFGMCGGIVGAFSLGRVPAGGAAANRLPGLLAYNAGRILTYAALGALAGALGATIGGLLPPELARRGARLFAALFLIGLGLFLADRPQFLQPIERLGARLWRRIEPLSRRLLLARNRGHAVVLGLLWGFLPCGLVYSMLAMASLAGGPGEGALVMLSFGAGTLPALFAAGLAASRLRDLARSAVLRRSAAAAYIAFGAWLAFTAIARPAGQHGPHGGASGVSDSCPPQVSAQQDFQRPNWQNLTSELPASDAQGAVR
ncbi:MAG: sulfite exporter TauE/SafE family protein [Thermoanaerobaculia bacterium]